MKLNVIQTNARALAVALFAILICAALPARAAEHFMPVRSMKDAESIKPGERIAVACGSCGQLTIVTADKDRTYLKEYTCEKCQRKFTTVTNPIGGPVGYFYQDGEGQKARLYRVK